MESVDNALRLLLLLAERDRLRVSEVAAELGVAVSTAHRLLATLKERGFVTQGANRTYERGASFARLAGAVPGSRDLVETAGPHLDALRQKVEETTHLVALQGRDVRFLASYEAEQVLRVTSRVGVVFPAHHTSGGKAILAALPDRELDRLYPTTELADLGMDGTDLERMHRDLATVRRRGYGLNRDESERGLAAIGMVIHGADLAPVGAFSVSMPSVRLSAQRLRGMLGTLRTTQADIEAELAR